MHWQNDPQRQVPLAVRGGPTVIRIWFALALLCLTLLCAAAVLA
jgi:hypothetical protein